MHALKFVWSQLFVVLQHLDVLFQAFRAKYMFTFQLNLIASFWCFTTDITWRMIILHDLKFKYKAYENNVHSKSSFSLSLFISLSI